ncbi:MAG: excinuclease ABC subunit UvrC [Balneolales bacterium]|nr:excinuclease ABC subunit UvrC [Balneolales bacterium]
MDTTLEEKISHLPFQPGVYQFKDTNGKIIYVGKAKKLRNRVRSYFQDSRHHTGKLHLLVTRVRDVEVIITDSEAEALILENNLIKEHQPRYNVALKDDKSYPYICLYPGERIRVFPTRSVVKDGSKYYGPYDHVGKMRNMLETIRKAFNLCTCACNPRSVDKGRGIPKWHSCFNEYFENCSGDLPEDIYKDKMNKVVRLLNGNTTSLIRELKEEMAIAAESLAFEEAAQLRDGIEALEKYSEKMKVMTNDDINRDVFAVYADREHNVGCGVLFKIREGKLIGRHNKVIRQIEDKTDEILLQAFVEDYYTGDTAGTEPEEVHLSHNFEDSGPLTDYLSEQVGRKVKLVEPKIGEKAQLVRMAESNARLLTGEYVLQKQKAEKDFIPHSVKSLKEDLFLDRLPRRIECFDNSNLMGSDPVASMVCFVDGQPRKSEYKRYNIKTVEGPDDFASMKEVLTRRYSRVMREKQHIPDLIVVDGGKGQLSSAVEALKEIGFFGQVPVVGLAKRLEEIFLPTNPDPIMIPKTSSSLKLMQRVRDEAHRFAITFHRDKRSKRTFSSELEQIPGIAAKTAQKLIKSFGSVKKIKEASLQELQSGAGNKTGEVIYNYFKKTN